MRSSKDIKRCLRFNVTRFAASWLPPKSHASCMYFYIVDAVLTFGETSPVGHTLFTLEFP